MSDYERQKGRLVPIGSRDLETTCEAIARSEGRTRGKFYDSWEEVVRDLGYRRYAILNDVVYKAEFDEVDDNPEQFDAHKNDDGTIDFNLYYYNGGCCFQEAIEEATKDMTNECVSQNRETAILVEVYPQDYLELKNTLNKLLPISETGVDLEIFTIKGLIEQYEENEIKNNTNSTVILQLAQ